MSNYMKLSYNAKMPENVFCGNIVLLIVKNDYFGYIWRKRKIRTK